MDKCCYCKTEIEGPVEFCIPEGFPRDRRHEGKPLCNGCGSHMLPSLDTICRRLDKEQAATDAQLEAQVNPKRWAYMGLEIRALLVGLPTDEARLEVLGMVTTGICTFCGRVLLDGERCHCTNDG